MKKPRVGLESLINPEEEVTETGVPQRGAEPLPTSPRLPPRMKPERRSDVLSIRIKPSVRADLAEMSARSNITQSELVEMGLARLKAEGY